MRISLSEFLDADRRFVFVGKFVDTAGVIWIVFEDRKIHGLEFEPFAAETLKILYGSLEIVVQKSKAPYFRLEVLPFLEYFYAFFIELLILQFPKN